MVSGGRDWGGREQDGRLLAFLCLYEDDVRTVCVKKAEVVQTQDDLG